MSTNILYCSLQKVHTVKLTDGFPEVEGIISCLYVELQGVSEVGMFVWRGNLSLFMVENIGIKTRYF